MPSKTSDRTAESAAKPKLLPKPAATPDTSLEGHLKSLVRTMIAAINARDFSPSSPAWTQTSSDFTSEPGFHVNDTPVNLHDFLTLYEEETRDQPEYFCRINDINVHVNSKKEHATVFAEVETNGLPPGVVRPSVGVVEFVKIEPGEWRCRKFRCVPGMDVLRPGENSEDGVPEA